MTGDSLDRAAPSDSTVGPLVLCVDDDTAILSSLRRTLRGEPYEVVTVSSAAQALVSLRKRPVDVIVSDEYMPGVPGCEFLAEVRDRWPDTGCVILTGHLEHDVMIRGFRAGVDVLLHKPWDDVWLRRTIRRLISVPGRPRPEAPRSEPADAEVDLGGEGG